MTLTLRETENRIKTTNFDSLPKPRKNKGVRGQLLELALGIPNSSKLTDLVDGELKSFTKGESIAVTQLRHTLPEVMNNTPFNQSKLGIKISRTLYVAFDRQNNFLGTATHTEKNNPTVLIEGDYQYICEIIRHRIANGLPLQTITGLNKVLQIRTKDSKDRNGNYHPIIWEGQQISNKGFAFYLTGRYAKTIV
jgi:DNA mismatch repair protein MutH